MTQTSRTFRIFVSSTFNDLKAERNALQEFVFPSLRTLAESHGCRFQAIDLRWGVSDEATHDQQTMKICLGEIARCQDISPRPNFIILLGNRYGWRPLPCEIPVNEYDLIFPHIPPKDRPLVVHWYRRDDNSSNPMFILQARAAEYIPNETWVPVEQQLHRILESAAENAELSKASLVKYTASATEQEINQGTIHLEDACQHVFSFAREIDNLFENIPEDIQVKDFVDCDQEEPDPHAAGKLTDLKTHLKAVLGENYREYKAHWEEKGLSMEHLDQLCKDVYHRLEQVILQEIAALEQVEPLEKEIAAHQAFGDGRASHFIGRAKILSQIDGYLLSSNNLPLAVWGESGSGKSALMAKAIQLTPAKHPHQTWSTASSVSLPILPTGVPCCIACATRSPGFMLVMKVPSHQLITSWCRRSPSEWHLPLLKSHSSYSWMPSTSSQMLTIPAT